MESNQNYTVELISRSEEETRQIGECVARSLPIPSVIGLIGTLGSGKTRFVQGLARGCGVTEAAVISPTFVLIHEYPGRVTVFHFDVYRLGNPEEFLELGPEEYFLRPGISVVEWADRVAQYLPPDRIEVEFDILDDTTRRIRVRTRSSKHGMAVHSVLGSFQPAASAHTNLTGGLE